jgi:AN1-type zinc finger protein 5/6
MASLLTTPYAFPFPPFCFATEIETETATSTASAAQAAAAADADVPMVAAAAPLSLVNSSSSSAAASPSDQDPARPRPVQKKKNRCWSCRRKVGILGFDCRCGYTFCSRHRYAQAHECDFNFRQDHQEKLRAANPNVKQDKFEKI